MDQTLAGERLWARLGGPRRAGKTTFLLSDLAPKAKQMGHRVVYTSFWSSTSPTDLLLTSLLESEDSTARRSLKDMPSLKRSLRFEDLNIMVDLSRDGQDNADADLRVIDQVLDHYADPERPTLLLFDEVQQLIHYDQGDTFLKALRTALDTRRDGLRSVFTGSSQEGLNRIFAGKDEPFYRFATRVELPPLTEDFVRHQLQAYERTFQDKLSEKDALDAFERLDRNPTYFQRWLQEHGLDPDRTPEETFSALERQVVADQGLLQTWLELSPRHRLIAWVLTQDVPLYGQAADALVKETFGLDLPKHAIRQSLMRRLVTEDVVEDWNRKRRIPDPLLRDWIARRPAEEFME